MRNRERNGDKMKGCCLKFTIILNMVNGQKGYTTSMIPSNQLYKQKNPSL